MKTLGIKSQVPGSNYHSQVEQKTGWDTFSQEILRRGNKCANLDTILGK